jgi:hypothetical protein
VQVGTTVQTFNGYLLGRFVIVLKWRGERYE